MVLWHLNFHKPQVQKLSRLSGHAFPLCFFYFNSSFALCFQSLVNLFLYPFRCNWDGIKLYLHLLMLVIEFFFQQTLYRYCIEILNVQHICSSNIVNAALNSRNLDEFVAINGLILVLHQLAMMVIIIFFFIFIVGNVNYQLCCHKIVGGRLKRMFLALGCMLLLFTGLNWNTNNLQRINLAASCWEGKLAANYKCCKIVTDCSGQLCHLLQVFGCSATSGLVQQLRQV